MMPGNNQTQINPGPGSTISNFLPFFTGKMKPIKRRNSAVPVLNKSIIVGEHGDLFTRVRCWIYSPTLEYPEISIFLQLKNASGSCFCKLEPQDIQNLSETLSQWCQDIQAVMPGLEIKKAEVNAYIDQYNQFSEMAQSMINQNESDSSPDEDDSEQSRDIRGRFTRRNNAD